MKQLSFLPGEMTPQDRRLIQRALRALDRHLHEPGVAFTSTHAVREWLRLHMAALEREEFRVLYLDNQNQLIAHETSGERRMSELKISPELLQISPEVQDALKNKKPVVALESTIISHGMPFPQNAQTAIEVEETIRKQGAVPATIAIIGGVMKVGLSKEEIELLGREGHNVTKVSRRDLPFVVAAGKNGATTVASTMIIAALAGIKVFATGGIGGVHRGAEHTFDISADLQELANTNVTVVCAGAKSILDLGLTTEYLETFGVPLIGYQTKALPAFFCRTSPFDVSIRLDSASEIARAMVVKWQSGLNGGLVVANPIPEQFAMPEHTINAAIDQAVAEAEAQGVIGKESTPFLLARVAELTGGDSLKSNIQLVFNNAILASEIAKEYSSPARLTAPRCIPGRWSNVLCTSTRRR